jgi:hypothetical protein
MEFVQDSRVEPEMMSLESLRYTIKVNIMTGGHDLLGKRE